MSAVPHRDVIAEALNAALLQPETVGRLANFSDTCAHEHWLHFELAHEISRRTYFGDEQSTLWAEPERHGNDLPVFDAPGNPYLNVEIKVLTNNKDFGERVRGRRNSVKRDLKKLRTHAKNDGAPGFMLVAVSRKVYENPTAWPSYKDLSLENTLVRVARLLGKREGRLIFNSVIFTGPVGRISDHIIGHALAVQLFELESKGNANAAGEALEDGAHRNELPSVG